LPTVAEGVERSEQAVALRDLGCTEAQGFLLGGPMALEDLLAFGPSIDPVVAGALPI
jgi:EAL domain-containing protein (putative c-di-GMP-specific phosphodiesterase class I)